MLKSISVLTSAGVERNGNEQPQTPMAHPLDSLDSVASTKKSNAAIGLVVNESGSVFDDNVETYLDERGNVRVSRVRAMGIRMTRDLQRNLDLMKEIEQESIDTNQNANNESTLNKNKAGVPRKFLDTTKLHDTSDQGNDGKVDLNSRIEESISRNGTSIEISFEDDFEHKCADDDDDLFARLVAGDPVMIFSADNTPSKKHSVDSASDCEWEEGVIEERGNTITHDVKMQSKPSVAEVGVSDESEVEWEEGSYDIQKNVSHCQTEYRKTVSKGALEEEADFQEAIRRSLEDLSGHKYIDASFEDEKLVKARDMANEGTGFGSFYQEKDRAESKMPLEDVLQPNKSSEVAAGVERLDCLGEMDTNDSPGVQLAPSIAVNPDKMKVRCESYPNCHPELSRQEGSGSGNLHREIVHGESVTPVEKNGVHFTKEQLMDTSSGVDEVPIYTSSCSGITSHTSDPLFRDMPDVILADVQQNELEAAANDHFSETAEWRESSVKESSTDFGAGQRLAERKANDDFSKESEDAIDKSTLMDGNEEQAEITEASLEEEMLNLAKERLDLGDEQRKLERNAESVSSEMFAECQELLQMFGLPYIIAPMEAEAQCAYMELANLVDGVVTDDSDVFLFGARSVYKNIFDDRKYVETYFMKDIENELGLTREKLIRMALLLGSDYTEGVSGIGIVNAIEVVNAFPEEDGLYKFREWIESPDPTILGKVGLQTGSSLPKKGSKVGDSDVGCSKSNVEGVSASDQNALQPVDCIQNMKQIFMDKHRNVSKNWHIPSSFPSDAVISAYASPQVDKSTEPFSWGKPDLFVLHKLCWEKFGWGTQKADELLIPVLKEYNKHETQMRLEAFYTFNERFAKIRSKRIKKAVKGIMGNKSLELLDDSVQDDSKSRKKQRVSHSEAGDDKSKNPFSGIEGGVARDETSTEKLEAKQSIRRRIRGEPLPSEAGISEPPIRAEGGLNTNIGSSVKGRGRGRGRGRGSGQSVGKRRKKNSGFEYAETSSGDGNDSDSEQEHEMLVEKYEGSHEIRKSTRPRKAVNYTLNDLEIDESGKTELDNRNCDDGKTVEEEPFGEQGLVQDAAGPCEKNHDKVGVPSLEEGLSGDYLEVGGGFCMDEAESEIGTVQPGLALSVDPLSVTEVPKEHLKMGGGFCLDADEADKDPSNASSPRRSIIIENPDPPQCSGFVADAEHDIGPVQLVSNPIRALNGLQGERSAEASDREQNLGHPNAISKVDHSKVPGSQENVVEDDSGTSSVRSLSAMPYLRRKRRKF